MAKQVKTDTGRVLSKRSNLRELPPGNYDFKIEKVKKFGAGFEITCGLLDDDRYNIMGRIQHRLLNAQRDALEAQTRTSFAALLTPELKRVYNDTYREETMATGDWKFTTKIAPKLLTPRTKREKALVDQTIRETHDASFREGFVSGRQTGSNEERTRAEAFLLKVVAASRGQGAGASD